MDKLTQILDQVRVLHEGVTYGYGLSMTDQVLGTAGLVEKHSFLKGEDRENAIAAALLHKCFDKKRVYGGQIMRSTDVEKLAGPKVLAIVKELATEPEDKSKSKAEQWDEKAAWAKTLSPAAQEILVAEKIMNFNTTRDRMKTEVMKRVGAVKGIAPAPKLSNDPKARPAWHREYIETRTKMVEALRENNIRLYIAARRARAEAMIKLMTVEKQDRQIAARMAKANAGRV